MLQPRHWSLHVPTFRWLLPLAIGSIALLLFATETWLFSHTYPQIRLQPESNEAVSVLDDFHAVETDGRGDYRWTTGNSTLRFVQFGRGDTLIFGLTLGPAPPTGAPSHVRIAYGGAPKSDRQPLVLPLDKQGKPRTYRLLVPPEHWTSANLTVHLQSATTIVAPDTRQVGLRLEGVTLGFVGKGIAHPPLASILVQFLFLATWALLLYRLHTPPFILIGVIVGIALLLLLLYHLHLLLMYRYLVRLLLVSGVLLLLTYAILPQAERYAGWIAPAPLMRLLWGVTMLACMLRLGGSLYPNFAAYDLSLNVGRLLSTLYGTLVDTNNSIEFRNGVTVYPSGPYVLLLPGVLAHIPLPLLVMSGVALIDGFGTLTVAVMARVFGMSQRTSLFAALFYAAIPINLTALWWGLSAQVFGQALMLPLTIALLVAFQPPWDKAANTHQERLRNRGWLWFVVLFSMALLSHIGVAILAVAWLGLVWGILWLCRTLPMAVWWSYTLKLTISILLGVALVYATAAVLIVTEFLAVGNKVATSDYVPAYWLIYRGFKIAFHELGFWLMIPGLLLFWRRPLPVGGHVLVGGWLGTVAVFWAIEMLTALQVRYIYFMVPLVCIGIGLLLDKLARRGIPGYVVAWAVIVVLLFTGSAYWYISTFTGEMMSVSPLLR